MIWPAVMENDGTEAIILAVDTDVDGYSDEGRVSRIWSVMDSNSEKVADASSNSEVPVRARWHDLADKLPLGLDPVDAQKLLSCTLKVSSERSEETHVVVCVEEKFNGRVALGISGSRIYTSNYLMVSPEMLNDFRWKNACPC